MGFSDDGPDSGPGGSADDGALEASTEECAEDRAPGSADEGALSGADTSPMVAVVAVVVTPVVLVMAAAAAVAHSAVEVATILCVGTGGTEQNEGRNAQDESANEHVFSDQGPTQPGSLLPAPLL
jgi:hypothetical protein